MTTLTMTMCLTHTPNKSAISFDNNTEYTFCESCEMNIEQYWEYQDYDRLPYGTGWVVSN